MQFLRMIRVSGILIGLLAVVCSSKLSAQILTGSIGGTVTDSTGAVVPEVKITATSPALIGGGKTLNSDAGGRYQLLELPPGTYTLKFEKQGFKAYTQQNILINTGLQVTVNPRLEVGEMSQAVTVEAQAATIDTEHVTAENVVGSAVKEGIPNGRSPWAIANTVAGVVATGSGVGNGPVDVGGSNGMQQVGLISHGSNASADQKFVIDGVPVNWPGGGGGSTLLYYDVGMFQEMNYLTGAMPADVSQGGVYMNMVTKSGSNDIHGMIFMNGASESMQTNNVGTALANQLYANIPASVRSKINFANVVPGNPMAETYDFNGDVGGAIIKNKLWWFTSWRLWAFNNLVAGSFNLDGTQALNDNKIGDEMGKFDYQINEKNRMSVMYLRNQKNRYHRRLQGSFGDNITTVLQNQPGYDIDLKWIYTPSNRWVIDTGFALTAGKTPYRYQNDVGPGAISVYDSATLTLYNAAQYNYINPVYRGALDIFASYFASNWGGSHNIKFGLQQSRDGYQQRYTVNSDIQGVLVNGVPTTATIFNTPLNIQKNNLNVTGLYVEDTWTIRRRLTLNYGLRWERWNGWIPAESSPAGTFVGARQYSQIQGPDWNNWTPRFGFAYDVTGKGKTVVKGSVSRYMQGEGMALLTAVNPLLFGSGSVPWSCNLGQACITQGPQLSQLNMSAFTGFTNLNVSLDPNLKRPYSWEESFGVQQELPENIILSVMGWHRGTFNQIGEENVAVPASDYTPVSIANPLGGFMTVYNQLASTRGHIQNLITNSPLLNNDYRGLDVTFSRRMTRHWMLFGGMTWSRNRGAWFGDVNSAGPQGLAADLNNPNYDLNRLGVLQTDVPFLFKAGGSYQFPLGIVFSTNFQHSTGFPLYAAYTVTSAILGQTLTQASQTVYAEPSGYQRLPSWNVWDVRISKEFVVKERWNFEPQFNIYNLGNSAAVQAENQSVNAGSLFLNPTSVMPPRLFEVGLWVRF